MNKVYDEFPRLAEETSHVFTQIPGASDLRGRETLHFKGSIDLNSLVG